MVHLQRWPQGRVQVTEEEELLEEEVLPGGSRVMEGMEQRREV